MNYTLRAAMPADAPSIATLAMEAMNPECCQYFAGPSHTLDDFRRMMIALIEREDSQYSYRHCLVAADEEGRVAGVIISYPGRDLHRLRQAFITASREYLDMDHSGMRDEADSDEYYIDSLAVAKEARHQGIASALLRAVIHREADRQPVGLLVDTGNPKAEQLYLRLGFQDAGTSEWGGHAMKHLQYTSRPDAPHSL